jgi:hypothetical protein
LGDGLEVCTAVADVLPIKGKEHLVDSGATAMAIGLGFLLGGDQDAVTASDLYIDVCRANYYCRVALRLGCQVFDKEKPLTA